MPTLSSAPQNDTLLDGGGGTDTLNIGANFTSTSDAQIANIENVTLTAVATTLNLANQTEAFNITGSTGADTITGGSGNDTITGGTGADTMTGGARRGQVRHQYQPVAGNAWRLWQLRDDNRVRRHHGLCDRIRYA